MLDKNEINLSLPVSQGNETSNKVEINIDILAPQCNDIITEEETNYNENIFINKHYKNLNRFVCANIEFYLLKLENVFIKTHGDNFLLTLYITLKEIYTLNDNN